MTHFACPELHAVMSRVDCGTRHELADASTSGELGVCRGCPVGDAHAAGISHADALSVPAPTPAHAIDTAPARTPRSVRGYHGSRAQAARFHEREGAKETT